MGTSLHVVPLSSGEIRIQKRLYRKSNNDFAIQPSWFIPERGDAYSVYLLPFAGVEEGTDVATHLEHLVSVEPKFHFVGLAIRGIIYLTVGPHVVLGIVGHLVYQHNLVGTYVALVLVGILLVGADATIFLLQIVHPCHLGAVSILVLVDFHFAGYAIAFHLVIAHNLVCLGCDADCYHKQTGNQAHNFLHHLCYWSVI